MHGILNNYEEVSSLPIYLLQKILSKYNYFSFNKNYQSLIRKLGKGQNQPQLGHSAKRPS